MIEPITAQEMVGAFAHWLERTATGRTLSQCIIAQTAMDAGIPVHVLTGANRTRPVVHARQDAMLRIHEETNFSLSQIGRMFHRDHTTVLYSIRAARVRRELRRFQQMPDVTFKSVRANQ